VFPKEGGQAHAGGGDGGGKKGAAPGNHPESEILRLRGEDAVPPKPKAVALYARVSSHDRKNKGDLDRQVERLRAGARELGLPEPKQVITDVASGLSDKRREGVKVITVNPAFTSLIGRVKFGEGYGLSPHAAAVAIARPVFDSESGSGRAPGPPSRYP